MPANLTDADEVVILEDDEFAALCDQLCELHPDATSIPPALLLAFAKLVLGFARTQAGTTCAGGLTMRTTHTAGPWHIDGMGNLTGAVAITAGEQIDGPDFQREHMLAEVYGDASEPNARLIAAAPDLYEALRKILRHIPKDAGGCSLSDDEHRARAALAKAEGRA